MNTGNKLRNFRYNPEKVNTHPLYLTQHPIYPGEYIPLPEVKTRLEQLQLNKSEMPLSPLLNMDEFEDRYKVTVVIPGVSREDIFIDVQNNLLSITVLHNNAEEGKKQLKIHEFEGKYFERNLMLPSNADSVFISAEYKAGILHIDIPKSKNPCKSFNSRIVTY